MPDWLSIAWSILLSIYAAFGVTAAVRYGLNRLQQNKQAYWFFGSSFVVFFILLWLIPWLSAT
jgi:hypothetical protein